MHFVDNGFFPSPAAPGVIVPVEESWIHNFAGAMHVLGLRAGGWIRNLLPAINAKAVTGTRNGLVSKALESAMVTLIHRKREGRVLTHDDGLNLSASRSP